jgi:hypothetical protein
MTLTVLKKNFHNLIDKVENKELLDRFYKALSFSASRKEGFLFDKLTENEKKILLKTHKESGDKKNLISHEKAMQKYSKWLTR